MAHYDCSCCGESQGISHDLCDGPCKDGTCARKRRTAKHPALGAPYGSQGRRELLESSANAQVGGGATVVAGTVQQEKPVRLTISLQRSDGLGLSESRLMSEINKSYFPESVIAMTFERMLREFERNGGLK